MTEFISTALGLRAAVGLLAVACGVGCATHSQPKTLAERFVTREKGSLSKEDKKVQEQALNHDPGLDTPALKAAMVKAHQMAAAAHRPPIHGDAATLESTNPELAAAKLTLRSAPTPENHRRIANVYARLGVLDAAYDHFTAAIAAARNDAAAYDGRARIWREWGVPGPALIDTYRAIFYAPRSARPRNTLGTILLKMGDVAQARVAFERALALDPSASYAANNLCVVSKMEGRTCQEPAR